MANEKKQYFLAPTWDYAPGGPIALGNVILSPSRPVPPLAHASTLNLNLTTPTSHGTITTSSTTKHNITWNRDKTTTRSLGVWTKFVEFLGLTVNLESTRSTHDIFRFERMSTEEFFPDDTFLSTTLLSHPASKRRLEQRKPVYVIVGVKTVSGAQVKRAWKRGVGLQAEVGVDMGAVAGGLPVSSVSVGPAGGLAVESGEGMGFEGGDDFVFAYRVLKVRLKRRRQDVVAGEYVRGAMLGMGMEGRVGVGGGMGGRIGDADISGGWGEAVEEYIEVEPLEEYDVGGLWEVSRAVDGDEGQEVQVFMPK